MNTQQIPRRTHFLSEAEPCLTCHRAQETIHHFLKDGDYSKLAVSFELLRNDDPNGTQHLDRWQADAALLAAQWDAAWEFRARGLLEESNRITLEDVINVRSRCSERFLSADDIHCFILSNNGLTPWGNQNLSKVNAILNALLNHVYRSQNTNPLAILYDRYANRDPTIDDFGEIADMCDYLISPETLSRHMTHEKYSIARYRERAANGADTASVNHDFYEWYTAPKKWCFQPIHGRFVEALPVGRNIDGSVQRRDRPRFGYTRAPGWMRVTAEALCQALLRRCENDVRREAGLPEIGEGWVSETELFRLIVEAFPEITVLQHARPRWLTPQHLDVYLPTRNIALEYQGQQHFEAIDFFGGEEGLKQRRELDARKRRLCRKNACTLIEVKDGYDPREVIAQVRAATGGGPLESILKRSAPSY